MVTNAVQPAEPKDLGFVLCSCLCCFSHTSAIQKKILTLIVDSFHRLTRDLYVACFIPGKGGLTFSWQTNQRSIVNCCISEKNLAVYKSISQPYYFTQPWDLLLFAQKSNGKGTKTSNLGSTSNSNTQKW